MTRPSRCVVASPGPSGKRRVGALTVRTFGEFRNSEGDRMNGTQPQMPQHIASVYKELITNYAILLSRQCSL